MEEQFNYRIPETKIAAKWNPFSVDPGYTTKELKTRQKSTYEKYLDE